MRNKGFTLVELSIVLVIIGLLIGGVLVAQSMVNTAKLSTLYKEETQYDILVNLFKNKYEYYPGDYPRGAIEMGVAGGNGNGDGFIYGFAEGKVAWQVMQAGLDDFNFKCLSNCSIVAFGGDGMVIPGENIPKSKTFKNVGYSLGFDHAGPDRKNVFFIGSKGVNMARGSFLTPAQAIGLDKKYDDGKAGTGHIKNFKKGCIDSSGGYVVSETAVYCNVIIDLTESE